MCEGSTPIYHRHKKMVPSLSKVLKINHQHCGLTSTVWVEFGVPTLSGVTLPPSLTNYIGFAKFLHPHLYTGADRRVVRGLNNTCEMLSTMPDAK